MQREKLKETARLCAERPSAFLTAVNIDPQVDRRESWHQAVPLILANLIAPAEHNSETAIALPSEP